jgi:hypothetical protein
METASAAGRDANLGFMLQRDPAHTSSAESCVLNVYLTRIICGPETRIIAAGLDAHKKRYLVMTKRICM